MFKKAPLTPEQWEAMRKEVARVAEAYDAKETYDGSNIIPSPDEDSPPDQTKKNGQAPVRKGK